MRRRTSLSRWSMSSATCSDGEPRRSCSRDSHWRSEQVRAALLAEQLAVLLTGRDDVQAVHLDEGIKLAAQTFTHDVSKLSCCASRSEGSSR
jgi:hypothetical protein